MAIARALVNHPRIILADEPTGALDSRTSVEIMAIFQRLNREEGITMIVVTHEPDIAAYAGRNIHFRDGRLQKDVRIAAARAMPPKSCAACRRKSPKRRSEPYEDPGRACGSRCARCA